MKKSTILLCCERAAADRIAALLIAADPTIEQLVELAQLMRKHVRGIGTEA